MSYPLFITVTTVTVTRITFYYTNFTLRGLLKVFW